MDSAMSQQINAPVTKSDDLNWIPGNIKESTAANCSLTSARTWHASAQSVYRQTDTYTLV